MDLILERSKISPDGVFGEIQDSQGIQLFVTLEHSYPSGPKIPDGEYRCILGMHRLSFGPPFPTYEIRGVPNHTNILFHYGNFNDDSEGCVLIGKEIKGDMITDSRKAFSEFIALQDNAPEFMLTVKSRI